ncbi:SDR family oxidoreductase [Spongiibacter sp. KMU-166]|uniref:SDR family oxidoreductase n=1 Tax=Spongiibacter thalassae TaxID=2721624 RepID=A0ABX1GA15_9GAMM|nr:SDR family NAD(P)-dependent oxidoreductase [Spongiibacter thalassae]NKI15996.1 SDR family oxidoreductase [Spongiibacter thalassae]
MGLPTKFNSTMDGKVAIVTGAGAAGEGMGIGRAIAILLAMEGASVCAVDLDAERAETTVGYIKDRGGRAIAIAGDVTDRDVCRRIVETCTAEFGPVSVLVNNVGIASPVELDGDDEEAWSRVLNTNLTSAMLMCRYVMPSMRERGGAIVNISSIAGIRAFGNLAYGPSKSALAGLTRELAVMYGREGVRVNAVAPGHILTPLVEAFVTPELRAARRDIAPLGVEGDSWDIAQAVRFLASDEARFITGVELPVDGGVSEIGALSAVGLLKNSSSAEE